MSRAALLIGSVGGIVGAITAIIGILWCQITLQLAIYITNYSFQIILARIISPECALLLIEVAPFTELSTSSFTLYSWILGIFLIVNCILLGVGFFGVHQEGGGVMGVVGLACGIAGSIAGTLLIFLGSITVVLKYIIGVDIRYSNLSGLSTVLSPRNISTPEFLFTWTGIIIVAVTFIVLGVASITVRGATGIPALSVISGIFSIVGACLFFPYNMFMQEITASILVIPLSYSAIAGIQFTIFGFVLIFVASILWTVLFYSTKTTIKNKSS